MSNEQRAVANTKRRRTSTPQQSSTSGGVVGSSMQQPGVNQIGQQIHLDLGLQQHQQMRLLPQVSQARPGQQVHGRPNQPIHGSSRGGQQLTSPVQPVQQAHQQQPQTLHPQFISSMHLDPHAGGVGKKNNTLTPVTPNHFNPQASMMVPSDSNQFGSYESLFRQAKLAPYTPQEMELINSLRMNNTIININRRC